MLSHDAANVFCLAGSWAVPAAGDASSRTVGDHKQTDHEERKSSMKPMKKCNAAVDIRGSKGTSATGLVRVAVAACAVGFLILAAGRAHSQTQGSIVHVFAKPSGDASQFASSPALGTRNALPNPI